MSDALNNWREKLAYLQQEEAIAFDSAQKFALKKQIEEAKTKIAELQRPGSTTDPASFEDQLFAHESPDPQLSTARFRNATATDPEVEMANRVLVATRHFADDLELYCLLREHPRLLYGGNFKGPKPDRSDFELPKLNMFQAHVDWESIRNLPTGVPLVTYEVIDYATARELRKLPDKPARVQILSACAILFSRNLECLFLHRRPAENETFGETLHTIGGAFLPTDFEHIQPDGNLQVTIRRQIHRKLQVAVDATSSHPIAMTCERKTGFIQVLFPVEIDDAVGDKLSKNAEIQCIRFDRLAEALIQKEFARLPWNPSGRAQILCWLLLKGPGLGDSVRFGTLKAVELFDHVASRMK